MPNRPMPDWLPHALAIAMHKDEKRSWPWYGRLIHWLLASWRCPCCKEEKRK